MPQSPFYPRTFRRLKTSNDLFGKEHDPVKIKGIRKSLEEILGRGGWSVIPVALFLTSYEAPAFGARARHRAVATAHWSGHAPDGLGDVDRVQDLGVVQQGIEIFITSTLASGGFFGDGTGRITNVETLQRYPFVLLPDTSPKRTASQWAGRDDADAGRAGEPFGDSKESVVQLSLRTQRSLVLGYPWGRLRRAPFYVTIAPVGPDGEPVVHTTEPTGNSSVRGNVNG